MRNKGKTFFSQKRNSSSQTDTYIQADTYTGTRLDTPVQAFIYSQIQLYIKGTW